VSNSLEHIAHIVHEQGYWRPKERVQNYHRQDVYQLGKSAQRLFDDSQVLARRVALLQARLRNLKQYRYLSFETTPQQVFDALAADADLASVLYEVEAIVDLLERDGHPGWFRWLLLQSRSLASIMRCLV
jgi:TRAP-type mannitol/chloroaromatic compound transport system substrate-binding protein